MKVFVTGGAGFIGSHTCVELLNAGHEVVVVDNLCNSSKESLRRVRKITGRAVKFYKADIRDEKRLDKIVAAEAPFDATIHFAALKAVGESVQIPLKYYQNNLGGTFTLATRLLAGAGYAYGNSSVLPFEKHFYSGGANSLRGWQARAVGPGYAKKNENFVIPSQTGDLKLEANAELRFGIYSILSGAIFTDVGNIWTINSGSSENPEGRFNMDNFPGSLAADWGFGLRFNFSVILLSSQLSK